MYWICFHIQVEMVCMLAIQKAIPVSYTHLLATFRTKQEGGEKAIQKKDYVALYHDIIMSKDADLIDVELFIGEEEVKTIVKDAHNHQVAIVMSNHDFVKTPSCDEIVARLKTMQERDADISKMAVMPQSKADVITLLSATNIMYEQFADRPITVSYTHLILHDMQHVKFECVNRQCS